MPAVFASLRCDKAPGSGGCREDPPGGYAYPRPAEVIIESGQQKGRKEDETAEFLHGFLFAEFLFSQQPALNELRVARLALLIPVVIMLVPWDGVWKAIGVWKSAQQTACLVYPYCSLQHQWFPAHHLSSLVPKGPQRTLMVPRRLKSCGPSHFASPLQVNGRWRLP